MMFDYTQFVTFLFTSIFTAFGIVISMTWWLSKQFSNIRHLMYDKIDGMEGRIVQKLEYHERHDDTRFNAITNDLWELRLHDAMSMGSNPPKQPIPRNIHKINE